MKKLKIEEFREIRKKIDEIFGEFIKYIDNEELLDELSQEQSENLEKEISIAEQEVGEIYEEIKEYDLSDIPFEEWNGFIWFFGAYDLEGTGANLDFSIIRTDYYNAIVRFKGCNIKEFKFEHMKYDDDSFDEKFKKEHSEHFLSKEVTDSKVRARYYNNNLRIADVVEWNLENIPLRRFSYSDKWLIEKIGLERAKTVDLVLIEKLDYELEYYLKDEEITEEINLNDLLISKIEQEIKQSAWKTNRYAEIPIVRKKLGEYFIDFGEDSKNSERLRKNYETHNLTVQEIIANYELFEGKKYAHSLSANNHHFREITEENVDKFYQDVKEKIPSLLKIRINWETAVEDYYDLETEEEKKVFIADRIKNGLEGRYGGLVAYNNLSLKDIYEFLEFIEIKELNIPCYDALKSIIDAKGIEVLNQLGDLPIKDLVPKKLEDAKKVIELVGTYDFLPYVTTTTFIKKYGIDNLIRFNRESDGMLDDFIMTDKDSNLYEKLHYDHQGQYKLPENATYEDFENILLKMLTDVHDRSNLNYSKYGGKIKEKHPEIYLPEDAPEELALKYYTRKLKISDFAEHPEWKAYFEKTRLSIGLPHISARIKDSNPYEYINIYDYFELNDRYSKEDMFNLLVPYSILLENRIFEIKQEIPLDMPIEEVKKYFQNEFYRNIVAGLRYSEDLPKEFKEAHKEIFISDRVPKEIKDKFYNRNISIEDLRKSDILEEELKDKDLEVLLSNILDNNNGYNLLYHKVKNERFLQYAHLYGEYMSQLTLPIRVETDEIEYLIKANIEENVLKGSIPYGPDAPDFLRETHPELFISDFAPELLKLSYYKKYTSNDLEYMNHSGSNYYISPRVLLEYPEWVYLLEGKNLTLGVNSKYKELFKTFRPVQILGMSQIDLDAIEAIVENNAVEKFEKFLNEESKSFAYRELLETENYTEEQIQAALETKDLTNDEYEKIRKLYNNKVKKFQVEIIKNPGVFTDYPYEKIEEFNFGEYKELKALSNFSQSSDCRRYMEENLISHIYAFLGYAEAKKLLQLPEMSKEEIDRLITEQQESFNAVYEKRFKLKGNVKVLNTFFAKFDPMLPVGKAKFNIYKSINQKLEEGFEGDIYELLETAFIENNLKVDKEKLVLCVSNSEAIQVSEKISFIKDEVMQKINDTIPENAADKKIIYDNLIYALKDSLALNKKIDREHIEILLKKVFSRLNEDGTTFYSPHVTEHISEIMEIIDSLNSNEYIANVLNKDLKGLLKEEKEKIGNGWIRKSLLISDDLTKEQFDELQAKLYGENGYSIEVTKQIELRDRTEKGRRKAFQLLEKNDNPNLITYAKAEKMFNSFVGPYSERFSDFFIKHKEEILANPKYFTILKKMNDNFDRIVDKPHNVNRYSAGRLTLEELEREINNIRYEGVRDGEFELEYAARLGGLDSKYFPIAQKLFEEMKQRTHQTIPQADITRGKYRGRILRIDDPLHLMVGDITTCCQAIGTHAGEGSMVHSATEKNGSVFVVEEYDEYGNYVNTVAQSWTWRNGDRICFDNVEVPDTLEQELKSKKAHEDIFRVYQDVAKMLLENDKKAMKKLLENGEITKEQYDSLVAKEVTMGIGCDDLVKNLSADTRNKLKKAKIVKPIEADKRYDAVQKEKALWIDSGGTQYIIAEMDSEERKEISSKRKIDITEIPLQYKRTREVISREGYDIHEDICKILKNMKSKEKDETSVVSKLDLSIVNQLLDEYDVTDVEKIHLDMNTNEDWFILSIDTEDAIRVIDTAIVEGRGTESQKEYDKQLALEEFNKSMQQLLLKAIDSGKRFECEILSEQKFEIFKTLAEEKIISIGKDGTIKIEDREKLKEKIEISRHNIEQGTNERNIAAITKSDSDEGR